MQKIIITIENLFFLLAIMLLISCKSEFQTIIHRSISEHFAYCNDIAVDSSGKIYISYKDFAHLNRLSIRSYDGEKWSYVDKPGFTWLDIYQSNIKITNDDSPVVAFLDCGLNNRLTVIQYKDASWDVVGERGISKGMAENISMAIDSQNRIYVAYTDAFYDYRFFLKRYENNQWVNVIGEDEFRENFGALTDSFRLVINKNETPYILYCDSTDSFKLKLVKIENGKVSRITISEYASKYIDLAIDSTGKIVIISAEENQNCLTIVNDEVITDQLRFNKNNPTEYNCVMIGKKDTPVLAMVDINKPKLMISYFRDHQLTGINYKVPDIKLASYVNIAGDRLGNVYVVFRDHEREQKAAVMEIKAAF